MFKVGRIIGCAAVACVFGSAAGNAAPITIDLISDYFLGAANVTIGPNSTTDINGTVTSTGALSDSTDWVEFTVTGGTPSLVNVDVITHGNNPSFPGETFQVVDVKGGPFGPGAAPSGTVVASGTASNTSNSVTLQSGEFYFLELNSNPPAGTGISTFDVTIPVGGTQETPLPAALPLFASGLGMLGFWGRRRRPRTA